MRGTHGAESAVWIILYFAANLSLTLHNKWVLANLHFSLPWTLSALHIGVSGLGSYLLDPSRQSSPHSWMSPWQMLKMLLFSSLYAINIAVSNISMAMVDLSFHQLVRSATPISTLLLEWLLLAKIPSTRLVCSLVPVMAGIALASIKSKVSVNGDLIGISLTVLGVMLASLKGISTVSLTAQMHPLELIWKMAIPASLQCLLLAWVFGELPLLWNFWQTAPLSAELQIAANAMLAMLLNCVSFTAAQKTSALTMTVAGNIKQALCIILAIYLFGTHVTFLNACGIAMALAGGAWYSWECHAMRRLKHQHAPKYEMVTINTSSGLSGSSDGK